MSHLFTVPSNLRMFTAVAWGCCFFILASLPVIRSFDFGLTGATERYAHPRDQVKKRLALGLEAYPGEVVAGDVVRPRRISAEWSFGEPRNYYRWLFYDRSGSPYFVEDRARSGLSGSIDRLYDWSLYVPLVVILMSAVAGTLVWLIRRVRIVPPDAPCVGDKVVVNSEAFEVSVDFSDDVPLRHSVVSPETVEVLRSIASGDWASLEERWKDWGKGQGVNVDESEAT